MLNKNANRGFTLIELLVVVFIIGILTAIAYPIYTTAVDKARFTNLMPFAKAIVIAQTEYYLTTGAYAEDFGDLSISLGDGQQISGDTATLQNGQITFKLSASGDYLYVMGQDSRLTNVYKHYFPKSPQFPGERHCEAPQDNNRANKLCKALNGTEIGMNGENIVYLLDGTGGNGSFQCTPVCTGGRICYNGACQCPSNLPTWDGSKCTALCTLGQSSCQCPPNTPVWQGGQCTGGCTGGQVATSSGNQSGCTCPQSKPYWDGTQCTNQCTGGQVSTGTEYMGGCSCPSNMPVWDGTQCSACPSGTNCSCSASTPVFNGIECVACPGGQVGVGNGQCRCPSSAPVWNGTQCINQCPGGQVIADGSGQCRCPSATPIWTGTECRACPGGQTTNSSGTCSCPTSLPVWDGTQCVAKS